jgi:type IV secretory pathway TraG/TraD family ATPase VirD4
MESFSTIESRTNSRSTALAFGIGAIIGFVGGAAHGAPILMFFGFWAGLMWPLLILAPLALWFCIRRQRAAREGLRFAFGISLGLMPWAWFDWYAGRGVNGNEIWFPIVLALLVGCVFAPLYVALSRSITRRRASQRAA